MADQHTATERRGVLFVFLAAVLYSIGGLCIKVIPWNGMSINSARNIISVLVVGSYLLLIHHKLRNAVEPCCADRQSAAKHVHHFHREIQPAARRVQTHTEIGRAQQQRIVRVFQPSIG